MIVNPKSEISDIAQGTGRGFTVWAVSGLFEHHSRIGGSTDFSGWSFVRVAVERGLDQGGDLGSGAGLTYKSREMIPIGRRVEVPLGRGNTTAAGVVIASGGVELAEGFAVERVKAVIRDTGAGLPQDLVELARWIAGYYVCPLGMVLSIMLPAAVKKRTGLRSVTLIERVQDHGNNEAGGTPAPPGADADALSRSVREVWERVRAMDAAEFPIPPAELMLRVGTPTMRGINALVRTGFLREIDSEDIRQSGGVPTQMGIEQIDGELSIGGPTPTTQQQRVIDGVCQTLGTFKVHLLRGVTGSGKTEVYLRVLHEALARGKSAIVLVPEISLTPQTAGRFVERFRSAGVAVLHSGLSASQRHKEWQRAVSGQARVVVGARSAVFAPLDNLGLVIVDEEHASDYKQDQLPRYHGRDVAIKRAQMAGGIAGGEGCPVLLGSATPSLESWANATSGKYVLWELTERVGGGRMPRVEVVDLNEERTARRQAARGGVGGARGIDLAAHLHLIGPTLERALAETLRDGGQAVLLLNRRGYACYIACAAQCGYVLGCEHCETRMVQHRVIAGKTPPRGLVRCHHCQAQTLLPDACPTCGAKMIALGLGTQRVEEELLKKFGGWQDSLRQSEGHGASGMATGPTTDPLALGGRDAWLVRVDGDTMGSAKDYFDVLSRFARGEIRVLLGTQMIAKGLDFPNVRLVGVINADTALGLPDFRASERTFQLVSQVAGRAGRGTIAGRVIVQTMDPSAAAIQFAAQHDYVGFAKQELAIREDAGLPPATRMARIVLRDEDADKLTAHGDELSAALRRAIERIAPGKVGMNGPMACPISRINGFHRSAIELISGGRTTLQEVLQSVRSEGLLKSDARTAVDIDPIALM